MRKLLGFALVLGLAVGAGLSLGAQRADAHCGKCGVGDEKDHDHAKADGCVRCQAVAMVASRTCPKDGCAADHSCCKLKARVLALGCTDCAKADAKPGCSGCASWGELAAKGQGKCQLCVSKKLVAKHLTCCANCKPESKCSSCETMRQQAMSLGCDACEAEKAKKGA